MSDRIYWLVEAESPVLAVIEEANRQHRAYWAAARAFAKEFGTNRCMEFSGWQVYLGGLVFDGEPPEGWRLKPGKKYCVPDRTKVGRAIGERMRALPKDASFSDLMNSRLCPQKNRCDGYICFGPQTVSFTDFERIGESYVLSTPARCTLIPPGCKELKVSEYYKLREDAGLGKDDRSAA